VCVLGADTSTVCHSVLRQACMAVQGCSRCLLLEEAAAKSSLCLGASSYNWLGGVLWWFQCAGLCTIYMVVDTVSAITAVVPCQAV